MAFRKGIDMITSPKIRLLGANGRSLVSKVSAYERHLAKALTTWTGTEKDFIAWADDRASDFCRNIGASCFVQLTTPSGSA